MTAAAAGLALVAVTLLSFFGAGTWLGELTTHFRPPLAAAALLLLLWSLACRRWLMAAAALVAGAAHAGPLLPYLGAAEEAAPGVAFRVVAFNLHHDRADAAAVAVLLEQERPDLVVLTELEPTTAPLIERLRAILPTVLWDAERRGSFEIALLTSWRVEAYEVDRSADARFPVARLRLCRETCVDVVALHAATPFHGLGVYRARQFAIAAAWLRAAGDRKLLVGDLNCTPWSPAFAGLLAAGGLRDSALGRGLWPTWFSRIPGIGLPIDHVLVDGGLGVRARRVGPELGSDHFPVTADLVLRGE